MNDNDIIKALEYCGIFGIYNCDSDCQMINNGITNVNACKRELNIKAIELITRQKAKIEALEIINSTDVATTNEIREIAIKEFADRLKKEINDAIQSNHKAIIDREKRGIIDDVFLEYCKGKIHALSGIDSFIEEMVGEME